MVVGARIRDARIKMGLTQEQLGDLIGISKVSVCGYEQGTRTPTLATFLELLKVLELEPDYLLGMDVSVVAEKQELSVKIRKEDLALLNEIKKNKELYDMLIENPSRSIKLINKKLYK